MLNTVDSDTRSEVLPIRRNEVTQNDSSPSRNRNGPQSHTRIQTNNTEETECDCSRNKKGGWRAGYSPCGSSYPEYQ